MKQDSKLIPTPVPRAAADRLKGIAKDFEFTGVADLIRASLAEYCQSRGVDLTVEELSPGQWGGHRDMITTQEGQNHDNT